MSIVVPIHDAATVTHRCLASLEKFAPQSEIILVDDGSKETDTLKVISGFVNRNSWKVVRHEKALGHSAASKAGADLATRPYLCLLNSDTVVTPWCWRLVTETFERDQKIGVAGPSTSCTGTVQSLSFAYPLRHYWNENQICGFAERLLTDPKDQVVVDLPWVAGFAFFIRRNLWEQLGGFDPNLPDYGNEIELCKRILVKGYRTVWIRNSYIHHLGEQSYRQTIGPDAIVARIHAAETYTEQRHSTHS
jgi:GT2 family glycosyltransferase